MGKRKTCSECGKAIKACICHKITKINSDIEIIILQHPSEVKNAIGTARILNLSLPHCQTLIGEDFTDNAILNTYLADPNRTCYLLYPSEKSINIDTLPSAEVIKGTFIILDGTWRKALKIYHSSTNLHSIQAVKYDSSLESRYTIRQTSVKGGLSTVEAGYLLLAKLDPEPDKYKSLLSVFDYMVEFQINAMPEGVFEKNYNKE